MQILQRRRKCELPKHLEYDMGEVNMTFAKGDHEEAIKQCMEVIRQGTRIVYCLVKLLGILKVP